MSAGSLFGIVHSNRGEERMWGKNEFNSCFPIALMLWMNAQGINPGVLYAESAGDMFAIKNDDDYTFSEIMGTSFEGKDVYFAFEKPFESFSRFHDGGMKTSADVIICRTAQGRRDGEIVMGEQVRPFEVKLTVVPDKSTEGCHPDEWAPEIVIRPATTSYCAMSMYRQMEAADHETILSYIREKRLGEIQAWDNMGEVSNRLEDILDTARLILSLGAKHQLPILLQPIWATQGLSPELAEDAFDVVVWTDVSILALLFNEARSSPFNDGKISRHSRAMVRLVCAMKDLTSRECFNYDSIYSRISFGTQTDKEISLRGIVIKKYISTTRFARRSVSKDAVYKIVRGDGFNRLSPERRLDQTLYFTHKQNLALMNLESLHANGIPAG